MLSKIQTPRTKQEIIKALQSASIQSVAVFESGDLNRLPSKADLIRQKATVIIVRTS
jgi:hypothetical protein